MNRDQLRNPTLDNRVWALPFTLWVTEYCDERLFVREHISRTTRPDVVNISRAPRTKVPKRTTSSLDFSVPLERSRRALQGGAIRFAIGRSLLEQLAAVQKTS